MQGHYAEYTAEAYGIYLALATDSNVRLTVVPTPVCSSAEASFLNVCSMSGKKTRLIEWVVSAVTIGLATARRYQLTSSMRMRWRSRALSRSTSSSGSHSRISLQLA